MSQDKLNLNEMKLDTIDKRILSCLCADNRYPLKKLSSELKVSLPMLNYRVKRLQKEIISPSIVVNYPAIDFPSYILLLDGLSDEQATSLKNSKETYVMYNLMGKYDYILNVVTRDIDGFLREYLSEKVVQIYPIINQVKDRFNPFGFTLSSEKINLHNEKIDLDKYENKILHELCINPSLSNFEISCKTKINWLTVKKKINALIEKRVIQKFGNVINVSRYNFLFYVLMIKCTSKSLLKIMEETNQDIYGGYIFRSSNILFIHYIPPHYSFLSKFISILKNIDNNLEIDVLQNNGDFYVNLTPQSFLDYLKEKSE